MASPEPGLIYLQVPCLEAQALLPHCPDLAGAVLVLGRIESDRALVEGVSIPAWWQGIRPGMRLQAVSRLPGIVVRPRDCRLEQSLAASIEQMCGRYTPQIYSLAPGELVLDIRRSRRLFGPALDCALALRSELRERWGIQTCMILGDSPGAARLMARALGPGCLAVVPQGREAEILAPQGPEILFATGLRLPRALHTLNPENLEALAGLDQELVLGVFGPDAKDLRAIARGEILGSSSVPARAPLPEFCQSIQLAEDSNDPARIGALVRSLALDAARCLRKARQATGRIEVRLDYGDGRSHTARTSPTQALVYDRDILPLCVRLALMAPRRVRVRSITVILGHVQGQDSSGELFDDSQYFRQRNLQYAIDRIGQRFGTAAPRPLAVFLAGTES